MKALEVALICSASAGFLRSVGSLMAGQCRLMECYSLPEAAQMIQLHRPDIVVFDVRSASPQQLARTYATISNVKSVDCVLVIVPGQLTHDALPEEILRSTRMIALTNHDENYHELVEAILRPEKAAADSVLENDAVVDQNQTQKPAASLQGMKDIAAAYAQVQLPPHKSQSHRPHHPRSQPARPCLQ